jgi:hypothetical protein
MGATARIGGGTHMASPWRRRRMCVLIAGEPAPAAMRTISATSAFLETNIRPLLGSRVELHHPDAGAIEGMVEAVFHDGVRIGFACTEQSVAFALAAITADMSKPA